MNQVYLSTILKNKYIITFIFFVVYVLIFSQNNLIERYTYIQQLRKLEEQKEHYLKLIIENKDKAELLKSDKKLLERFAREQYLMKKTNEEIYIVIDE